MELVALPRQQGKTTRAIEWLREDPQRILITHHEREKLRLIDRLEEMDKKAGIAKRTVPWSRRVLTAFDRERLHGISTIDTRLGVDNMELVLQSMFGWNPIHFGTVTKP